jgi:hypothetical protein
MDNKAYFQRVVLFVSLIIAVIALYLAFADEPIQAAPKSAFIRVTPSSLSVALAPGVVITESLSIQNVSGKPLEWMIEKQGNTATRLPGDVLFNNGPVVNLPDGGAGGADASTIQTNYLLTQYGWAHSVAGGFRVADNFTIPAGEHWTIDQITFYAFQTDSGTASPMTEVNLRIWNGRPDYPNSRVVFGDTTTNRLVESVWIYAYRVRDDDLLNPSRPIMANTVDVGTTLTAGTYWLDWQTAGEGDTEIYAPPITITGQPQTGDALWYSSQQGGWDNAMEYQARAHQGFPFIIEGTSQSGSCLPASDIPWLTVNPTSGTTNAGEISPVALTFDSTALAVGTYTSTLCIISNDIYIPALIVPLTLTVQIPTPTPTIVPTATPPLSVDPTAVNSTQSPNQQTEHSIALHNDGVITLSWGIYEASNTCESVEDVSWLEVNPQSGVTAPGATTPVTVILNSTDLLPGIYEAQLCIQDTQGRIRILPVTLTVTNVTQQYYYLHLIQR